MSQDCSIPITFRHDPYKTIELIYGRITIVLAIFIHVEQERIDAETRLFQQGGRIAVNLIVLELEELGTDFHAMGL